MVIDSASSQHVGKIRTSSLRVSTSVSQMPNNWVVVADSGRARSFAVDARYHLGSEIETLENPEARLYQRELITDRPGRTFDRAGEGRHAMAADVTHKDREALDFAKRLAIGSKQSARRVSLES